ncbi:hypothetical protein BMF89_00110 [Arthrobacter sp. SRS-W-1-2016]|uniref:hypothetical protein n=1 Tax=Arthrobacter sp. SRS-W-1-2016 TaxID=1930254 RepID=UPI0009912F2E|nr:hypothetical protein [Arthrobacter sp. SRS-W-1-2016]OOP65289.1 hypothetical protein BMF89_00110 [Arthrobacter sp. SRS-W-1-2016]
MLHTIKDQGGGFVPTVPWEPTVRYPMLHGFSAAAWQRVSTMSFLTFIGAGILTVGFAIASNKGAGVKTLAIAFYCMLLLAGLTAAVSGAVSTYKARREYRHGYTTLQSFSKYGMYYRTLPQLDPRSGVQVRAAGEAKLAQSGLTQRWAVSRARYPRADRMSRQDAAEAAATAKRINETNLELVRAKSTRARLVNRFGAAAGNMRADARKYTFAALLTAGGGLPALIFGLMGASLGKPVWVLPAIVQGSVIAVLALIGRRKSVHAARLAAEFLGVALKDLPPWTSAGAQDSPFPRDHGAGNPAA